MRTLRTKRIAALVAKQTLNAPIPLTLMVDEVRNGESQVVSCAGMPDFVTRFRSFRAPI